MSIWSVLVMNTCQFEEVSGSDLACPSYIFLKSQMDSNLWAKMAWVCSSSVKSIIIYSNYGSDLHGECYFSIGMSVI